MKKYVKPMIVLEHYKLSQNIANCAWELTSTDNESCSAKPDNGFFFGSVNGNLFTQSNSSCTIIAGVDYEDYCYQNGANSPFNVFTS